MLKMLKTLFCINLDLNLSYLMSLEEEEGGNGDEDDSECTLDS